MIAVAFDDQGFDVLPEKDVLESILDGCCPGAG
jgi:hypothetical protein